MSSSDFSKPLTTDTYGNFASEIVNTNTDLAKGLDPATTAPANLPSGSIAWSSASNYWQKWSGSAWTPLTTTYAISISGNAASASTAAACTGNAASASTASACSGTAVTATTANALNTANFYQVAGLGIGVVPSAWVNTWSVIDCGAYGAFGASTNAPFMIGNSYYNGTHYVAKTTGLASQFYSTNGIHYWMAAASVTAGSNQTFAQMMSLDASGNLVATGNVSWYSDDRLKSKWKKLPKNLISFVAKMKAGSFWRKDLKIRQFGISAQQLREILPETVLENSDGIFSANYGSAAMVICVELCREVEKLKTEIAALRMNK